MPLVERRRRRSEFRAEALDLCLEACRAKGDFELVVIADDAGLLVGASTSAAGHDATALAAALPVRARRPERLSSVLFKSTGQTLFVGALGGSRDAFGTLADAIHGARRILGAAQAA